MDFESCTEMELRSRSLAYLRHWLGTLLFLGCYILGYLKFNFLWLFLVVVAWLYVMQHPLLSQQPPRMKLLLSDTECSDMSSSVPGFDGMLPPPPPVSEEELEKGPRRRQNVVDSAVSTPIKPRDSVSRFSLMAGSPSQLPHVEGFHASLPGRVQKCIGDETMVVPGYPVWERAAWLDETVSKFWPYLRVAAQTTISESLSPIIKDSCPSFLSSLTLHTFLLGDSAPEVRAVRVHSLHPEELILDLQVRFLQRQLPPALRRHRQQQSLAYGDALGKSSFSAASTSTSVPAVPEFAGPSTSSSPHVVLAVGLGLGTALVKLQQLQISATVRVVIKQFTSQEWPCFKSISLSLAEQPTMTFNLSAARLNVMHIPGFSSWIKRFLVSTLQEYVVWPKQIPVEILASVTEVERLALYHPQPLFMGLLAVVVQKVTLTSWNRGRGSASDFHESIGGAYVTLKMTDKHGSGAWRDGEGPNAQQTSVLDRPDHHGVLPFQHTCQFIVCYPPPSSIQIQLWSNQSGSEGPLSRGVLRFQCLPTLHERMYGDGGAYHQNIVLPLTQESIGDIHLSVQWQPKKDAFHAAPKKGSFA